MRVAHWNLFAEGRSGMTGTGIELVRAQKELGLDCGFIDAFDPKASKTSKWITTETYHYADGADVYVLHSHVPDPWVHDGTPIVVMLHGMPHYSWETELYLQEGGNQAPFSQLMAYFADQERFRRFVTLWSPQMTTWDTLDNYQGRVRYVRNGIDLTRWTPDGPKRKLAGKPVLLVADQSRMCKDPFPLVWGCEWFREQHEPQARLHFIGMPPLGCGNRERDRWENLLENSGLKRVVASRQGIVFDPEKYHRTADILVTSSPDESRVIKEAIACGCDVVSPFLNTAGITEEWLEQAAGDPEARRGWRDGRLCLPRTREHDASHEAIEAERACPIWETVNYVDAEAVASQIAKTWEVRSQDVPARRELLAKFAANRYDMRETAKGMIDIYAEVFAETREGPIIQTPPAAAG